MVFHAPSSVETAKFLSWAHADGLQIMANSRVLRLAPWHNGLTMKIFGLFAHVSQLIAGDHPISLVFCTIFFMLTSLDKLVI